MFVPNIFYQNIKLIFQLQQKLIIQMCGRLFQTLPLSRLLSIARTSKVHNSEFHTSSFNVCPTTYIPVIRKSRLYPQKQKQTKPVKQQSKKLNLDEKIQEALRQNGSENAAKTVSQGSDEVDKIQSKDDRQLTFMKWGQKTDFNMIINGRIEELSSKRTFVKIIQNRCVVIMEGYYQWKSKQQPFCFKPKNSDHFLVAGLYTDDNEIIILTKDATPELSPVHQRMPCILTQKQVQLWLDPSNTKDINVIIQKSLTNKTKPLWKNIGFAKLAPYVNKREEKSIKCLMTIEQYKKQLDNKGLMRFWKKKEPVEVVGKQGQTLALKPNCESKTSQIQLKKKNLIRSSEKLEKNSKIDQQLIEKKQKE